MPYFYPSLYPDFPRRFLSKARTATKLLLPRGTARVPAAAVAAALLALTVPALALTEPDPLPDAPQPQSASASRSGKDARGADHMIFGVHVGSEYPEEAGRWDTIINPGEHAGRLTAKDKLLYAGREQIQPIVLLPALVSAGYGQITDANPHYGTDAGGFGGRFGSAMLRQATDRISGDGLLAAAFHQDPRYYREGNGTIVHRGVSSVRQTFLRRNDEGAYGVNASGILSHVVSNFLALTYYPHNSATASVAAQGFGTSMASDMGSKLLLEFGPDILRKVFVRNP